MERCVQCNSPLKRDETVCYSCEAPVLSKNPKKQFSDKFRITINAVFIFFALVTVGSLLTNMFPSFWKCFSGLVVLYLVKNSADNMATFRKKP
jgi:predicted nucleic acid-binding Zn ribbon protein